MKHRKSSSVRSDEGGREQLYNKKVKDNADKEQIGGEEWKVIITLGNETGHFHSVWVSKSMEKEIGKINFVKLLNNRRILISAINKRQQKRICCKDS